MYSFLSESSFIFSFSVRSVGAVILDTESGSLANPIPPVTCPGPREYASRRAAQGVARGGSIQVRLAYDSRTESATIWAFRPSRKLGMAWRFSWIAEMNSQTRSYRK